MLSDLNDAYKFYDGETEGYVTMPHFRNILQNFGFHKMSKKEIDEELKKADPEFLKRTGVDFNGIRQVVALRWMKSGREDESKDCFKLIDKRDRNYIQPNDLITHLKDYL